MERLNILLCEKVIGYAQVTQCGLYLRFCCVCDLPAGSMYRIWITGAEETLNLGVLSPYNGRFILDKKIAANRIGHGEICLRALPVYQKVSARFIPLSADVPFQHIHQLHMAKFGWNDGIAGIYIDDSTN